MQESETNQVNQLTRVEQSNSASSNKLIIPILIQPSVSYLNWQQPESKKNKSSLIMIGTTYSKQKQHECCQQLDQIATSQGKNIQNQIQNMNQMNQLILDHSKLLEDITTKNKDESEKYKSANDQSDVYKEIAEKERKLKECKEKCEKEIQFNQQRLNKIKDLNKTIIELEEQSQMSNQTISLSSEVETWKNKYLNLLKQNEVTQNRFKEYSNELEQLKQNQSLRNSDVQQSTTTVTTTRKRGTLKPTEQIQL
ncbi:unnamed protein product [Paramecium sonneborni]|uniref:Uncharacterized protein n=1 Tax=Paramecium sonneborni TaxID=65129 RepID=A0A8S1MY32_9CILI|nr:unnamed protein product [Paramecium sonneborni]